MLGGAAKVDASLGGDATSVTADRVHAQGALVRVQTTGPYAVHEMQTSSGTLVREFVDSSGSGKVFAVAWEGPWMPDLRQVLGDYFDRYQAALRKAQQRRRVRGAIVVHDGDLVVETSGRSRAFSGRAYLTTRIPAGVQPAEIR